jgi:tRNA A37 methylthiotransferase MiaB
MNRVYLKETYESCTHNSFFLSQICNFLIANQYQPVTDVNKANYIILCTCGLDTVNKTKAKKIISEYYNDYGNKAKIIVTGCFSKLEINFLKDKNIIHIDISNLIELDTIFKAKHSFLSVRTNIINTEFVTKNTMVSDEYYIQIGQGCSNNCTYCSIKNTPIFLKSKPIINITEEIMDGLQLGYAKFVLLADDCGCYGEDINLNFADLLNAISKIPEKNFKLNIHYFHPSKLLALFPLIEKDIFNRIYFINIPIQSVSEKILKMMNRNYNIYEVINIISQIKSINPAIKIHSRLIYGYSADAHEEFNKAVEISKVFDKISHFHHSDYELFSYRCFC